MNKENEHTKITESDLEFLKKEVSQSNQAFTLQELSEKLAFKKTSSQLQQEVKKYEPFCRYEEGDLLYKEYDEPLMVSSKGVEHFKGSVVLKVMNKIAYENFNCEMLEVGYSGGGIFRKHIDYMKKTKTKVLLPSNYDNKGLPPQILKEEEDPRLDQVPMTDKDLRSLEKNLSQALLKSEAFFNWNIYWQLKQKQTEIPKNKIEEIKKHFRKTKQSAATTELCSQFLKQDPKTALFELNCLNLNFIFEQKYKKDFVFVSPINWGKWHLKEVVDGFLKDLPLSAPNAKVPSFMKEEKAETAKTQKFPLKLYLTWREILSGGIKIPKNLRKPLSEYREYTFTNTENGKDYTVFFYPSLGIFLGLKEFYENNNVPQGASLTLEKTGPGHFSFWFKKSKKKLSVPQVDYDPKKDKFLEKSEEVFTFSLPNKIIHLERDTLIKLFSLYEQRDKLNLKELLILIFNHFGLEGETLFLHYLRAFHLVDVLKQTSQEDVEKTLLAASEFNKSEKKKGIFFYKEKVKAKPEVMLDDEAARQEEGWAPEEGIEIPGEAQLAIGTIEEEVSLPEAEEEIIVVEEALEEAEEEIMPSEPLELFDEEAKAKPKKEAPPKKRREKVGIEGEVVPRRRKGEKKILEERIELEESELEALFAVKEKQEKEAEKAVAPGEKVKEEFTPPVSEEPKFGVFAEMLKSALDQKKKKSEKGEKSKKKK